MTTLIAAYDGEGRCIGRCDARCYNAKSTDCECICNGANHGVGGQQALDNVREMFSATIYTGETTVRVAECIPVTLPGFEEVPV